MYRLPAASLRPLSLAIALAVLSPLSHAAEQYRLESGPLSTQLNRFAAQAGIFLVSDGSLTEGQQSRVLDGSYSVEQALAILLEGSGLEAVKTGEKRYEVRPRANSTGLELSAVSISGKAPGSITEGTGSYTTGSTSSSTRLNLTPQETPQSVTVITRQRMEDQKLDDLADALDATTGIVVKPLVYGGDAPQILSRGSSINNFQIDGVPTSSAMGNYLQATAMYDRIEVVRGATGIMSGLGKPSATINMVRKRPTFDPQVSFTAEAGNWDRYGSGVDVSGPMTDSGNVRGRLVADYKHQHGWTDNYEQERITLYGISEIDLSDDTLLTLGFSNIAKKTNSQAALMPMLYSDGSKIDLKPSDIKTPDWAFYDHDLTSFFASIEHTFGSGWSIKSELSHARYEYESLYATSTGAINKSTGAGGRLLSPYWVNTTEQENLDTYLTGPFSLLGREHEFIGGVTLTNIHADGSNYTMVPSTYLIPTIFTWADDTPKPHYNKTGKTDRHEHQYNAYMSSRFHLTDSTSLLVGGRLTDWKNNNDTLTLSTGRVTKSRSRETGIFTPYLGLVHALNDTWSLYGSYTKIFQPQDSLVSQYVTSPEPEDGTSIEAGIKASFQDGRLNSSLSLFRTNQDNLAVWNNASNGYEMYNNTATEGAELEFNGALAEGWNFSSGYVYSVTRNDEDQRIITRAPRHSFKTFTTYRLPGDLSKFTVGGGFNWESKTGDDLKVMHQGSYTLVNLMGRYEINQHLSVSANINNLFDKEYIISAGVRGSYGMPRNFMTSLKYTY
ncbi:TonB-dependent receptor [Pseudomonas sp. LJDD11]|uniref:TonB-dependent siderophore receptor n=1 Tax=Pseudomonas sp. LJDD11 TaxID=2931984 RepID=UPI00211CF5F0|nr:TonB-dependent receptor [Pseudomonas sp. LJDD11]MCQ9427158.1 TonB-dependent receptor [Pseudomonas sp. LJDD11]